MTGDLSSVLTAVATLIAAIGTVLLGYLKLSREGKAGRDHLMKQIEDQGKQTRQFTDTKIRDLNGTASSIIHSMGKPCWIKLAITHNNEVEFRMQEVSSEYEALFGIKRLDYIGKTDLEAGWDHNHAHEFRVHDLMVWASGEPETYTETIKGVPMRFRKVRVQSIDGVRKGVMGWLEDTYVPVKTVEK